MQGQQDKRILPNSSNCSIVWNDRLNYTNFEKIGQARLQEQVTIKLGNICIAKS